MSTLLKTASVSAVISRRRTYAGLWLVETRHAVDWVVVDTAGQLQAGGGDTGRAVWWRSTAKPFQALAALPAPILAKAPLEALAVATASHTGTAGHRKWVRWWLAGAGLDADALQCGTHAPINQAARAALRRLGHAACALHHNCSGKHARMLWACQHHGWPVETYRAPDHPLQKAVVALVTEACGETPEWGVDGCTAPVPYTSLAAIGRAYLWLLAYPPAERLLLACRQYPQLLGGQERIDTRIIQASHGNLIAKVGAAGLIAVLNTQTRQALVLKVKDGHENARNAVIGPLLGALGWLVVPVYPPGLDPDAWDTVN